MKPLHYTASALALGLALMGNAQAVTTIPFWHSMEGELGKEVDSLAQRFNAENPDYKIVPTYKGNYEQNLSAGIAAFRTGNAPAILQVYEVGTATMMASKAIKPVYDVFKEAGFSSMSRSLCRRFQVTTRQQNRPLTLPAVQQLDSRSLLQQRRLQESRFRPGTAAENLAGSGGLCRETESLRYEVRLRQRLAGLDPTGKL
ncbi:hypothetical protein ECZU24_53970 [Escherichia coli]|nr:hypothetical protein ECZU24_53970 [Escherichia coli]